MEWKMGRPRAFDENEVLDRALMLFWERGFEGTSLNDLLASMKMTKSSLYKAFGSKEALFRRVLDRYESEHVAFRSTALAEPTPRRIAAAILHGMVQLHSGRGTPRGCLGTNAALACSPDADRVRSHVAGGREEFRVLLRQRLERTSETAALPAGMDADVAASLIQIMIQGLAVQAKAGSSTPDLEAVVSAFLTSWPTCSEQTRKADAAEASSG